jgi:hypothetical protein
MYRLCDSKEYTYNMSVYLGRDRKHASATKTAVVWKDKQNVNTLTNMHHPPAEGNFCDGMEML